MDHEDAYDMTTYDEKIVINGDDDHYHSKIVEEDEYNNGIDAYIIINNNNNASYIEEEYVEEETIKSSIIANDFTRSIPKLRSSSSSSGRHSSSSASTRSNSATSPALSSSSCSFVSRKNFYTRRSFNVDHFDESPTMIRIDASNKGKMDTSPLQPKSLGNFSNHVDIVEENSPLQNSTTVRAVRMNDNIRSSLLLDQHPRIIDPEEEECTPSSTEIACNQDSLDDVTSELSLPEISGDIYIFVDGLGLQSGNYQLSVSGEYQLDGPCDPIGYDFINCPLDQECLIVDSEAIEAAYSCQTL